MITNFNLNETEVKNLNKFLSKVPKSLKKTSLEIIFSMKSGIGIGICARKGAYSKDITDYSGW